MTLCVLVSNDAGTLFLYLRSRFLWSLEHFTVYSAVTGVYSIFCTMFVVYVLYKVLNIPESVLILVGLLSVMNSALMIGLASSNAHIYAGTVHIMILLALISTYRNFSGRCKRSF